MAVWMITNDKNGISSYEVHRAIGVTQKTAWFMVHRIRLAMQTGSFDKKMGGDGGAKLTKRSSAARLGICTSLSANAESPAPAAKTKQR